MSDADPAVLAAARLVLTRDGGHGAVREICDLILRRQVGTEVAESTPHV